MDLLGMEQGMALGWLVEVEVELGWMVLELLVGLGHQSGLGCRVSLGRREHLKFD